MFKLLNILNGNKVQLRAELIYESAINGPIGIALALIRESEPHYHNETTEWYLVTKGNAVAFLDNKEIPLKEYDVLMIEPKTVHYIKSDNEVEIWVISYPPWRKEDHHLVNKI
jgi:mannose-6-phosphate isomerase-like protein (cupin superfamily)